MLWACLVFWFGAEQVVYAHIRKTPDLKIFWEISDPVTDQKGFDSSLYYPYQRGYAQGDYLKNIQRDSIKTQNRQDSKIQD